jgi:hypothetical protein
MPMELDREARARMAERARHAVYGSVIVLAVIVALDETSVSATEALASTLGAAIATLLAELYADYLGDMIREGRAPARGERTVETRDAALGMLAAVLPAVLFVLATLDVVGLGAAFDAAVWTGVGVVGFYAFVANRLAGASVARSIAAGIAFAALGAILVVVKTLAH